MIISDLHAPFDNPSQTNSESAYEWYSDSSNYSEQQMPTWIKNIRESETVYENYSKIHIKYNTNSFCLSQITESSFLKKKIDFRTCWKYSPPPFLPKNVDVYFLDCTNHSAYTTLNWGPEVSGNFQIKWKKCLNIEKRHFLEVSQLLLSPIVANSLSDSFEAIKLMSFLIDIPSKILPYTVKCCQYSIFSLLLTTYLHFKLFMVT